MTTVSIVNSDSNFCLLLTQALSRPNEMEVVSSHTCAKEALLEIPLRRPDVVLMDIVMPGMTGIECARQLRRIRPPVSARILFLTDHDNNNMIFEALKTGADGYLSKGKVSIAQLADAIKQVALGEASITPDIARKLIDRFRKPASPLEGFSDREEEVLAHLARGLMYKEIASMLGISLNTVRQHVRSIYEKLHVQSRAHATLRYLERTRGADQNRIR